MPAAGRPSGQAGRQANSPQGRQRGDRSDKEGTGPPLPCLACLTDYRNTLRWANPLQVKAPGATRPRVTTNGAAGLKKGVGEVGAREPLKIALNWLDMQAPGRKVKPREPNHTACVKGSIKRREENAPCSEIVGLDHLRAGATTLALKWLDMQAPGRKVKPSELLPI